MRRLRVRQILIVLGLLICLASGLLLGVNHRDLLLIGTMYVTAVVCVTGLASSLSSRTGAALSKAQAHAYSALACGIVVLRANGRITWLNEALCILLGRSIHELQGAHFRDLMGAEAWDSLLAAKDEIEAGQRVEIAGALARTDGNAAWVSAYASPLGDGSDRLVVQVVDVSADRDRHASLLETVTRYRHAVDTSDSLIIMIDEHGRIRHANPTALTALTQGAELAETSILDFIEPGDRRDFVETLKHALGDSETHELTPLHLLAHQPGSSEDSRLTVRARIVALPESGASAGAIISCRILDRQLASEKQLRTSEARFSRIFHSSPDAILILRNDDSTILDFNAGFTRLLGYTREDAIGRGETDLGLWVHAVERERLLKMLATEKECIGVETKLRTKDGTQVFVEISLRYIEIEGELCVLCIGRDVSKRALAEAALQESQEKFGKVFSHSPDGIVIIRQDDMTICDINDAFIEASGYTRDELVGSSLQELNVLVDESALPAAVDMLVKNGQFTNLEMLFQTRFGQQIPALVSATTLEVGEEPCVLCIARDMRDLRSTEEQLRVSEERFRGTFENAPIGILLLDMEGRIFQANRFAVELLGYGEDLKKDLHVSQLVPSDERPRYEALLARLANGTEEALRTEQRMLCENGLEIWTNMHIVLQRAQNGDAAYCIVQIADITEMKVNEQRMEHLAFYDILTDLANRRLFYDRLAHAIDQTARTQRLAALLYLDLDQFKRINDTLGHEAGDVLLRTVAERLTQTVRKVDTVGRPGGDEFTILLYEVNTPSDASHVAEKILDVLRRPITISGQQLVVTTSIGITIVPTDGTSPTVLMKNADLAMYRAKDRGRNQYQFYSEEMNTNAARRLQTEFELRRAIEENEFELHYQPIVRLSDQQVVGVECLIRWQHPDRGLILPGEFIEVAEETGAIVDIGKWVIETACVAAKQLDDENQIPVRTSLNISSRQFHDPELVATIRRSLRQTGLNPNHLELEITETMLMHDVEAASQTLHQLHDLGLRLAIDDFGTGYSSLNYLKKFPIDTIKVDRSFIMDIPNNADDMAITSAVIAMAHRLNMEVVAEGVETAQQLEFLRQQECDYAQGFLFSKAVPLDIVKRMFAPNVRLLRGQ